jgi:integrase
MAMLLRCQREADQEAEGIFDHISAELAKPIGEHVDAFVTHLKDKGSSKVHWQAAESRLKKLFALGKITRGPEITKARIDSALAALRSDPDKPASMATSNHYLGVAKHFAQWLVDERRNTLNGIAGMKKRNVQGHRVKFRRPLSQAEFQRLLDATAIGPVRKHLSGKDRAALYLLASFTGYRRRELTSVTPASFTFGESPRVDVVSGYSKRRRDDRIPLNREVAQFFEAYTKRKPKACPLWKLDRKTAEMIRADMDAAGIDHKAGGVDVDFHSLRQTFTTGLARSGASPKVTQQLARHSDVNLTMSVYAKMDAADERAAVEALPVPSNLGGRYAQQYAQGSAAKRNATQPVSLKKPVAKRAARTAKKRKGA